MNNETQQGYLVLADISGYTSYLGGVELAHARDILAELLELIVEYYTLEYPMAIQTQHLTSQSHGTQLNIYFKLNLPLPRWLTRPMAKFMFRRFKVEEQFEKMARMIAEEAGRN